MLIHNYSSGAWGKGTDLVKSVLETDKWIKSIMREVYKDFLTKEEIEEKLFRSDDIYLQASEIKERWARVLESRALEEEIETEKLRDQVRDQIKNL
jgi:ATP-dependent protease ClpP protease subunit